MRNLLLFLQRYTHILLFLVLELVSLALLFSYGRKQGTAFFNATGTVVGGINSLWADAAAYSHLREVNTRLEDENTRLKMQNDALRQMVDEQRHTPTATEQRLADVLKKYPLIPAKVTSNEQRADRLNHLIINRGRNDGVRDGMGVVGGGGVVGVVAEASANYALVVPVTHQRSAISCRLRGTGWFGYLVWEGGSKLTAYLDDIPRYADVTRGMAVETSGYSDIFPPGIFVGNVLAVGSGPDGQSLRLTVHLATDFSNLRDVSVVGNIARSQTDTLRNHAAFNEGVLEKK
ncbi:MAG: rod shape-determining protein MreC [Bacteroidaceae bacterium]|nr:rod shape-determining protein MreC [Bacteroidaceae bacterium]